jgi:methanogenesis imperfect marker protein 11
VLTLEDPSAVVYRQIHAVASPDDEEVEILERSSCFGGGAWSLHHYSKGPLVIESRSVGEWFRYHVRAGRADLALASSRRSAGFESVLVGGDEVEITYAGLGGGGVGATVSRSRAGDVLRCTVSESGGGTVGRGTIVRPRRERICAASTTPIEDRRTTCLWSTTAPRRSIGPSRYYSHDPSSSSPVPTRPNCLSTVVEFAALPGKADPMLAEFQELLERYTVSEETGMAVYRGFDPSSLMEYSRLCRTERIDYDLAIETARKTGAEVVLAGRGLIGLSRRSLPAGGPVESVRPGA